MSWDYEWGSEGSGIPTNMAMFISVAMILIGIAAALFGVWGPQ